MSADPNIALVDRYVDKLEGMKPTDRDSAMQAFSHLAATVNQINQTPATPARRFRSL